MTGVHMNCLTYWLDFWRGDMDACLRELDTMENVRRMYGGETRRALLEHYRRDLENAKKYGAGLVIIYADNTFETFNVDSFELKDDSYSKR